MDLKGQNVPSIHYSMKETVFRYICPRKTLLQWSIINVSKRVAVLWTIKIHWKIEESPHPWNHWGQSWVSIESGLPSQMPCLIPNCRQPPWLDIANRASFTSTLFAVARQNSSNVLIGWVSLCMNWNKKREKPGKEAWRKRNKDFNLLSRS